MAVVRPFAAVRPAKEYAGRVAALPYDVYNRKEAKAAAQKEPLSFLCIDRAETQLSDETDIYDDLVYQTAAQLYRKRKAEGVFIEDSESGYYIYQLEMAGRRQTGVVACASVDDYQNQVIKKHENTREEKEQDRIRHVDALSAQTGPIFLAYRSRQEINAIVDSIMASKEPLYDFTAEDGIAHRVWKIDRKEDIDAICHAFEKVQSIYIADGHHRAASAVKVSLQRREQNPGYTGQEEFNYFLSVLFPDDQLMIMDYNRTIKDLNGLTAEEFLREVGRRFSIEKMDAMAHPSAKGEFVMYLDGQWYRLRALPGLVQAKDVVEALDVSVLQNYLLRPVLGIDDPRTDSRIDFIGGIRGLEELKRRADSDSRVSFALYPTSIQELFSVADAGLLMPPKSTWFEPKLRSGLLIHEIGEE